MYSRKIVGKYEVFIPFYHTRKCLIAPLHKTFILFHISGLRSGIRFGVETESTLYL